MSLLKHLPNAMTCGNLLCGCLGLLQVAKGDYGSASLLIFFAAILDFGDGFVARLVNAQSAIGKELDSLADMVTFGVLPAFIMFHIIQFETGLIRGMAVGGDSSTNFLLSDIYSGQEENTPFAYLALLLAVCSALRLAKFNIDSRQTDGFIGVPTPANALLVASLPLMQLFQPQYEFLLLNRYVTVGYVIIMGYLMVSELPLFALKFKSFAWAENRVKYSFLITSVLLLLVLQFAAIPLIVLLYIVLSLITKQ